MLEIIALIFFTKHIGKIAIQKGLKPGMWKAYTVACWVVFEIAGIATGVLLFNQTDFLPLMFLGLISAFGGFLLIRSILQKKPDATPDDDINSIGVDDLKP